MPKDPVQQTVLGRLDSYVQNIRQFFNTIHKNELKMDYPNVRLNTIKLLEENRQNSL